MLDIKPYLPYYIGRRCTIKGVSSDGVAMTVYDDTQLTEQMIYLYGESNLIPHLRKQSRLTLNEMTHVIGMRVDFRKYPVTDIKFNDYAPEISAIGFTYVGSKQYDCIVMDK